jgi:ribosomal protein S18 acetylase RimI-like enzyme
MGLGHVEAVVRVHMASFPGFFLTSLGPQFLRVLYSEILRSPNCEAFVGRHVHGTVCGFVVGVTNQTVLYARLARKKWWAFALCVVRPAVRRPGIMLRLLRAFRRPAWSRAAAAEALLMSIGVAPDWAGHGVGRQLVEVFLDAMRRRGVPAVSLITDRDGNDRINRFYQSLGFRVARTHVSPEGRWMNEYLKDLAGPQRE